MDHAEFDKNIIPFINGTLPVKKRQEMIEHLSSCSSCNDELEVYYIILNCVRQLDADEDVTDNYHESYIEYIKKSERDIRRYYNRTVRHRIAFPIVTLLAVAATGLNIKRPDSTVTVTPTSQSNFTDNDLIMRFRFSENHKYYEPHVTDELIKQLLSDQTSAPAKRKQTHGK
ncbi:MAG: hypothetical protein SPL99_00250 [Catonella sp.]|nr:hypothetical protein [Catonella sp.]MDY6356896.1 hypothetical protein [Catonella sp.]